MFASKSVPGLIVVLLVVAAPHQVSSVEAHICLVDNVTLECQDDWAILVESVFLGVSEGHDPTTYHCPKTSDECHKASDRVSQLCNNTLGTCILLYNDTSINLQNGCGLTNYIDVNYTCTNVPLAPQCVTSPPSSATTTTTSLTDTTAFEGTANSPQGQSNTKETTNEKKNKIGLIVGAAAGGGLLIVMIIIIVIVITRFRKKRSQNEAKSSQVSTSTVKDRDTVMDNKGRGNNVVHPSENQLNKRPQMYAVIPEQENNLVDHNQNKLKNKSHKVARKTNGTKLSAQAPHDPNLPTETYAVVDRSKKTKAIADTYAVVDLTKKAKARAEANHTPQ